MTITATGIIVVMILVAFGSKTNLDFYLAGFHKMIVTPINLTAMNHQLLKFLFSGILLMFFYSFSVEPFDDSTNNYSLFNIERSKDPDEIFYDINLDVNGDLNTKKPINVYWVKRTKGGKKEPLTWIQKKYAYGLKFLKTSKEEAVFRFAVNLGRNCTLKRANGDKYKVYLFSKGQRVELNKIFIQFDGGTFLAPNISRVELHATDAQTGTELLEIITPQKLQK